MKRSTLVTQFNNTKAVVIAAAKNAGSKIAAGGTALMASVDAFAQAADPAGAIKTEMTGAKASVGEILVICAGIVGVLLLWAYIKRAH